MTRNTNTAQAAVPGAGASPTQRWKTTAASNPPGDDAAGFLALRRRVEEMVVTAEKKRGRAGYHAALDRLRIARAALLYAENKMNRKI